MICSFPNLGNIFPIDLVKIYQSDKNLRPYAVIQMYDDLVSETDHTDQFALSIVPIAGFDPLFYFHHSNIDRYFWKWQQDSSHQVSWSDPGGKNDPAFPDSGQRGLDPNQPLTIDTALPPFGLSTKDVLDTTSFEYTYNWPPTAVLSAAPKVPFHVSIDKRTLRKHKRFVTVMRGDKLLGANYIFSGGPSCPNCQVNNQIYVSIHLREEMGGVYNPIPSVMGMEGIKVYINGVEQPNSVIHSQ